jgi:GNAT superfamily N-acetyltransferase
VEITTSTLAERPELIDQVWAMPDTWDEFMDHDPVAEALFGAVVQNYRQLGVVATDATDTIVAHGTAMALCFDCDGRQALPDKGWDQALIWAHRDLVRGAKPDTACALEVSIHTDWLGRGLSQIMFGAIRDAARSAGFATLIAPVRPSEKHLEPDLPMDEYAKRTRDDGLPTDAWLRVHARLGGVIEQIAPASQTISGSLDQWRAWTGLDFAESGPVYVPGALAPVQCLASQNVAVYVEPNVWVRHDLS